MRIEPKDPSAVSNPNKSLGELFGDLSKEVSALVKQEVQLAKTEITGKLMGVAKAGAALAVAAVLGLGAFLVLLAAAVLILSIWLQPWAAALIVAGALLVLAGLLAFIGFLEIKKTAAHPLPTNTIETLKEDAQWLKNQVK